MLRFAQHDRWCVGGGSGGMVIEWRGVTLGFGGRVVLRDFSLAVAEGERVVIRGASGVGKSTLFRVLLGFEAVDAGAVFFRGRAVDTDSVWAVRREVAYVPQAVALGAGTVRAAIESVLGCRANRGRDFDDRVIEDLGLARAVLGQDIAGLSGGERQRVGLAIALTLGRKVFLLDEPTAALDVESRRAVVGRFAKLPADCAVVVISHDEAWDPGARVVSMPLGEGRGSNVGGRE